MLEALDRYLRAGFFWFWICVGILLAFNSYDGYGTGMGALFFGIAFLFYGLRRLKNRKSGAVNVRFQRIAITIYSVGVFVVGIHGSQSFIQEHEANFAPLLFALEQYRNTTGQYPDELAELMPDYVTSLPECPVSGGWAGDSPHYSKRTKGEYKRKKGQPREGTYIIQCVIGVFLFPQRGLYESEEADWWYTD